RAHRHRLGVHPLPPAAVFPKGGSFDVVREDKERAAGNANLLQLREAVVHHCPSESLPPIAGRDGEVVKIPAPPVVATENPPQDSVPLTNHARESRIAAENPLKLLARL